MKIFYLIDSFGRGGRERQLCYIIDLIKKDHQIFLFIFSTNVDYEIPLEDSRIHICSLKEAKTLRNIVKFLKFYINQKPQFLHFFDNISFIYSLFARIAKKSYLIDGTIRYAGKLDNSFFVKALKFLKFNTSDKIVANSKAGLQVEQLLQKKKSKVIYNGIDSLLFKQQMKKNSDNLDFLNGFSVVIVMLASLTKAKDYKSYISVAKKLSEENEKLGFICVGYGYKRSVLEKQAGKLLNKNIFFLGNRKDIPVILGKSDIGVLLSNTNGHAEGLSNSIMEYMAASLPVVATNAGGTPELVKDGESGFLVPAFDYKTITEKITYLIDNPDRAELIGEAGRKIIEKEFSIEKMINEYLKIYNRMCSER